MHLTETESLRYARQLSLPEVGPTGQLRLKQSRVLIVGTGGLGCPVAQYLAAAGVGQIGLVDPDQVSLSNLQRQILYRPDDLGQAKVKVAASRLQAQNPDLQVIPYTFAVTSQNAQSLVSGWDLVIDGSDQLPVRYLLNATCLEVGIPMIYGSLYRFSGQVSVFASPGPCYRCLFPEMPATGTIPDCNTGGVLGAMAGLVGLVQALEALKWLLGHSSLQGKLLMIDGWSMGFESIQIDRDPRCPGCGPERRPLSEWDAVCQPVPEIPAAQLKRWLQEHPHAQLLDLRAEDTPLYDVLFENRRHLPLEALPQELHSLQQNEPVLLFCQRGVRSQAGARLLLNAGFHSVCHLQGGLESWNAFTATHPDPTEIIL